MIQGYPHGGGVTSQIHINMHISCVSTWMEQALKERERKS